MISSCEQQTAVKGWRVELLKQVAELWPQSYPFYSTEQQGVRVLASDLRSVVAFLRNDSLCHFDTLVDIAVTDRLTLHGRFVVNYHFLSTRYNTRFVVQVFASELSPIPSLTRPFHGVKMFPGAGWLEREAWDLFGCYFSENADLRRILTDYGYQAHPLRRDFPLTGFTEISYDDAEGRVVSSPVELAQEFRVSTFYVLFGRVA